jgi:hypothetical protein
MTHSPPASPSSYPVGLFYSMASLSPIKTAGMVVDLATHPAPADGGQLSARILLSEVTRWRKAGGVF